MESRRFFLIAIMGVLLFFTYQAWQTDYPKGAVPSVASNSSAPASPGAASAVASNAEVAASLPAYTERVKIVTDKIRVEISLAGGDIRRLELIGYPVSKAQNNVDLALLDDENGRYFIVQSGLAGATAPLTAANTLYTAQKAEYVLTKDQKTVDVPLVFMGSDGITVTKLYRFTAGSYKVELVQTVAAPAGSAPLSVAPFARITQDPDTNEKSAPFTQIFKGVGVYEQKENSTDYRFSKHTFEDLVEKPITLNQNGGWVSMLQHYFVAAILPPAGDKNVLTAKRSAVRGFIAEYNSELKPVLAGESKSFTTHFYLGPKEQGKLDDIAPGFELTEDYGVLTPVAKPLFWLLNFFHGLVGNWGVAIILLTIVVKGSMYKLSEAQYRSMAKMKFFTPRIQEIRERYAGDREKLNKAMMELYQKEGFNPLAGCWPLLVQMPIFLALLWVLQESVELRLAPFVFWLNDLSAPDSFYLLPVLYGASMWVQQKMTGQTATMDPMQQKMMNVMPIALTAMFVFFPTGVVLYWLVSNIIGIAQQWFITQKLEKETAAKALLHK